MHEPRATESVRRVDRHSGDFSFVDLSFTLRRLRGYYASNVIIPCFIFTAIS